MELTSKQRARLRALASVLEPVAQLGKGGINDTFLKGLDAAIEKRELIKVTVLKNAELSASEALDPIAAGIRATAVCAIGNKIVLYRRSTSEKVTHIEF